MTAHPIGVVVEGQTDRVAVANVLATRSLVIDPNRVVITNGKQRFDARLPKYNLAARHGPWLALRDADHDADGCPVALRRTLLTMPQSPALCLRLAVRTLEAWLLADADAFATHFAVTRSAGPETAGGPGPPEGGPRQRLPVVEASGRADRDGAPAWHVGAGARVHRIHQQVLPRFMAARRRCGGGSELAAGAARDRSADRGRDLVRFDDVVDPRNKS